MKKYICLVLLVMLVGCASTPAKYLRKNCESADEKGQVCPLNSLCYCEDVPEKAIRDKH